MNENKEFEHEIDPDLLAEIEEWEKAGHDEPAEYYFSNPDPYLKPQPLPPFLSSFISSTDKRQ